MIAPDKRNAKLAELMDGWVRDNDRENLRLDIIKACREMWDVYLETARDWETVDFNLV
jgi:hypothetical protein